MKKGCQSDILFCSHKISCKIKRQSSDCLFRPDLSGTNLNQLNLINHELTGNCGVLINQRIPSLLLTYLLLTSTFDFGSKILKKSTELQR